MTVPFLDLFKKITERFTRARASEEPRVPAVAPRAVKKPASERLSKTVLPNATRSFSAPDLFEAQLELPTRGAQRRRLNSVRARSQRPPRGPSRVIRRRALRVRSN